MPYTKNTMFEVTVSNSVHNQTQNVPGMYGTYSGSFAPADCDAGRLVTQHSLIPLRGYEGLTTPPLNGNTWYFVDAANGTSGGAYGDHTGIFAANTYDVNRVTGNGVSYNLGANTLGLGIPSGERGNFTELLVGEHYAFGSGNFTGGTAPTSTNKYCTIANGLMTAASSAPAAGTGVYLEFLYSQPVAEGAWNGQTKYVMKVRRTAEAASE